MTDYKILWDQSCQAVAELCELAGMPEGGMPDLWTLKACIEELRRHGETGWRLNGELEALARRGDRAPAQGTTVCHDHRWMNGRCVDCLTTEPRPGDSVDQFRANLDAHAEELERLANAPRSSDACPTCAAILKLLNESKGTK